MQLKRIMRYLLIVLLALTVTVISAFCIAAGHNLATCPDQPLWILLLLMALLYWIWPVWIAVFILEWTWLVLMKSWRFYIICHVLASSLLCTGIWAFSVWSHAPHRCNIGF